VLGAHEGVARYTVGQRRGLALSNRASEPSERLFVTALDPVRNVVVVGTQDELGRGWLRASAARWVTAQPEVGSAVLARVRYHAPLAPARVARVEADGFELAFERPVRAVAPGQAAVLYALDGREVLGGGTIEESRR